jgi:hypothetical protein
VLFSHGPNKAFLVPDSCRATELNGNSISADVTDNANVWIPDKKRELFIIN